MGLNIGATGTGDFLPWVKYNAKVGRWYTKKDEQEIEVKDPVFVADLDNIKTGWFYFMEGMAPDIVIDPDLSTPAPKPSENHKRGFKVNFFSKQLFDGVVEFSANSTNTCAAVNDLYIAYESGKSENAGKLPVVACKGTEAIKGKFGTNYKPLFEIVKWVDRPSELDAPAKAEATTSEAKQATQEPVQQSSDSEF